MRDSILFFARQCLYALTFFAGCTILAEMLAPGMVTPFLDPIPFAIGALLLLVMDGFFLQKRVE